jgi:hypothetical protein
MINDPGVPIVLGRLIAHELGHYLLGMRGHSRQGLMRPVVTSDDVMSTAGDRFALDAGQRRTLRASWLHSRVRELAVADDARRP